MLKNETSNLRAATLVAVVFGILGASAAFADDPENLLTDGDFENCALEDPVGPFDALDVTDAGTLEKWLSNEGVLCLDDFTSTRGDTNGDGQYAEVQPNQSVYNTVQGVPLDGDTCAVAGTEVTLCLDQRIWSGAAVGQWVRLLGLGDDGFWTKFAGGGPLPINNGSCGFPLAGTGTALNFPSWCYDSDGFDAHNPLINAQLQQNDGWERMICQTATLDADYTALAVGIAAGYGGSQNQGDEPQVAFDNVSLFVSKFDAEVDVDPDTLNPKSQGKWITVYLKLPECFSVYDVNDNVKINKLEFVGGDSTGTLGAADSIFADKCEIQDDGNGGYVLMCKFPREEVIDKAEGLTSQTDMLKIRVRGTMYDGRPVAFSGLDTIGYLVQD